MVLHPPLTIASLSMFLHLCYFCLQPNSPVTFVPARRGSESLEDLLCSTIHSAGNNSPCDRPWHLGSSAAADRIGESSTLQSFGPTRHSLALRAAACGSGFSMHAAACRLHGGRVLLPCMPFAAVCCAVARDLRAPVPARAPAVCPPAAQCAGCGRALGVPRANSRLAPRARGGPACSPPRPRPRPCPTGAGPGAAAAPRTASLRR